MGDGTKPGKIVGLKVRNELIHCVLISLRLYICFGAMLLCKTAVLQAPGVSYARMVRPQ
jgi:hypothetical protein